MSFVLFVIKEGVLFLDAPLAWLGYQNSLSPIKAEGVSESKTFGRKRSMIDRETKSIHAVASEAITSHLGDIGALPEAVQSKVQSVYHAFFTAYLGICQLKRPPMTVEREDVNDPDPEVLDYMQHCFSDYQHLFRQFEVLNRRVRALLPIDRERLPFEFQAYVEDLLSDRPVFPSESILEEILETSQRNR
jgi:hypothetical protein